MGVGRSVVDSESLTAGNAYWLGIIKSSINELGLPSRGSQLEEYLSSGFWLSPYEEKKRKK